MYDNLHVTHLLSPLYFEGSSFSCTPQRRMVKWRYTFTHF